MQKSIEARKTLLYNTNKKMLQKCIYFIVLFVTTTTTVQASVLRVVGGHEAPNNFGYFHASLQNLTGSHVCGGAVVSEQHVVTAAHCVQGAEPQYIKVVVGTTNLDKGGSQYDVEAIKIYNDFNLSERANDIAIMKVVKKFKLNDIQIIQLDHKKLNENDSVILTGFGAIKANGESSRQMHMLHLTVFSQKTCKYAMRYSREVTKNMFCTFTGIGEGTCHGDSGGPLIKNNKLVGLVSWGIPCAVGFPDVHTRIAPYVKWIQQEIENF